MLNQLEVLLEFDLFICVEIFGFEFGLKLELKFKFGNDLTIFLINNTLFRISSDKPRKRVAPVIIDKEAPHCTHVL